MSGQHFIKELTPEMKQYINDLKKQYPNHTFKLLDNHFIYNRGDLMGTYSFIVRGPIDPELATKVRELTKR